MSKYYKADDVIRKRAEDLADTSYWEYGNPKNIDDWIEVAEMEFKDLPTIEVSEEDEFKFYYVESIDDYWIGRRLDNFYYAEWRGDYFVWTHSRYLPWGEHIVDENTLWKEHTYPSEPREIPFGEWIVGFMKKYGSEVSEDCISRDMVAKRLAELWETEHPEKSYDEWLEIANKWCDYFPPSVVPTAYNLSAVEDCIYTYCSRCGMRVVVDAPSVVPTIEQSSMVHCKDCKWKEPNNEGDYDCKCHIPTFRVPKDGYCNFGERIEE